MTETVHAYPINPQSIVLGAKVKDRISGFEGIASAKVEYLTGCTQIGVMPVGLTAEGKTKEWQYFDWQRLEIVDEATGFVAIGTTVASKAATGFGELPTVTDGPRRS